jgi:hypothetical protein
MVPSQGPGVTESSMAQHGATWEKSRCICPSWLGRWRCEAQGHPACLRGCLHSTYRFHSSTGSCVIVFRTDGYLLQRRPLPTWPESLGWLADSPFSRLRVSVLTPDADAETQTKSATA